LLTGKGPYIRLCSALYFFSYLNLLADIRLKSKGFMPF